MKGNGQNLQYLKGNIKCFYTIISLLEFCFQSEKEHLLEVRSDLEEQIQEANTNIKQQLREIERKDEEVNKLKEELDEARMIHGEQKDKIYYVSVYF